MIYLSMNTHTTAFSMSQYLAVGCLIGADRQMRKRKASLPSIGFVHLLSYAQSMATNLSTGSSVACTSVDMTSRDFNFIEASTALATLATSRTWITRHSPAAFCVVAVLAWVAEVVATNKVDLAMVVCIAVAFVVGPFVSRFCTVSWKEEDLMLFSASWMF